ncbi:amidase [Actinokineospora globicatena]|uniref:amidase n=1 Tax=Actinokineospora globicatena TaxID=103729 RepID=UPI0020A5A91E|nr:amidase [Actinokineospora globicatena]MCP2306813.1 aspartyl-tRNA(Asn)/glutamyl-tRNA(Gln) amidotransferase subunit A [Actinokineospora globicatena]GLW82062.1 amidase [Actinokineospora globicatena]GLW88856.1 amidase [Actinokineospora globicatena]
MDNFSHLSATRLADMIRRREVSPVEVVKSSLEQIEQRNPEVNAFVTLCAEEALDAAQRAERAVVSGEPLPPLHGVPIGVKDLDPVAGVRMTRGSAVYADLVPTETVECVARLVRAGAIVVGKTNTPEFGHKATTDNSLFGPTSTPFNLAMNSGGSSGGSAAAVAAGMVPIAQGSDAGGSLRVPASFCGVYTLMSTFGRVAVPARPNAFRRLNPMVCFGALTRTVADSALVLDLMSGPHPRDPYSFPVPDRAGDHLDRSLAGVRVAYLPTLGGYPVEPEVDAVVRAAVPAFTQVGAQVDELDFTLPLPHDELTAVWRRYLKVAHAESVEYSRRHGLDMLSEWRDRIAPEFIESAELGALPSAVDAKMDDIVRTQVLDAFEDLFDTYDLVVSPVNCVTGIANDQTRTTKGPATVAGVAVDAQVGWSMTSPFNFIGSPAASVPAGLASNGVPVGLQIAARRGNDVAVAAASAAFERVAPWHDLYLTLEDRA